MRVPNAQARMTERAVPLWVGVAGAVLVGVLTATQARVNGSLGDALGDGLLAAFISFGSGLALVALLALAAPPGRAGLARLVGGARKGAVPAWMLLGGVAGALTVATQSFTVPVVGVAMFTVGLVAGQTLNGILLDRVGFGPAGVVAVTMRRVVGAALAVSAVGLCVAAVGAGPSVWALALAFAAGAGIAWQQATNGRLRHRIDSALTATVVNFCGGTLVLGLLLVARLPWAASPGALPHDAWMYLGGLLGMVYIFLSAAIVRYTGVLLLGLGSVVGLLATSVVFDAFWPARSGAPLLVAAVATLLALVGVAVVVQPRRSRRR